MKINEFITHFKGVKPNGDNKYMALCPAHNDTKPSLSIGYSKEHNHILINCFAGCKTEEILNCVGLKLKDLYENEKGNKVMREKTYIYYNSDKAVAYRKIRIDYEDGKKTFYFKKPNGEKNMTGVRHELYNLPNVLDSEKVYFVEGEKCAEELIKQGLVATTLDSGANSPWMPYYGEYLKDKEVIIIPDNDDAGMSYAEKIAENIPAAKIIKLPDLKEKEDIYDWLKMNHKVEELDNLPSFQKSETESNCKDNTIAKCEPSSTMTKATQVETILQLLENNGCSVFCDENENVFLVDESSGSKKTFLIESEKSVTFLNYLYYSYSKTSAKKENVLQAIEILKGKALYENPKNMAVHIRVAKYNDCLWYDLGNERNEAVVITDCGWEVVKNPPVLFISHKHQKPQCYPDKNGDVRKVLNYINIKKDQTLFLCWLISCFIPEIPHVMPIFFGEKGAAKTTTCELLKNIIDPSVLKTLSIENRDSLMVSLNQHWFLPFDNVSRLSVDMSDIMCRAITGGGVQKRKLYTDSGDCIYTFKRCLAINGINNVVDRPDLLDRSILIELCRISEWERRELLEIEKNFQKDLPSILGGIFNVLSKAMKIYPTVNLKRLPRMADFARWGYAIGEALGGLGNEFLEEYNRNQESHNIEVLNSDVVATLIVEFMKDKAEWTGLISQLHGELSQAAPQCGINCRGKDFPSQPNVLSRRLGNLKSNLSIAGISFTMKSTMYGKEITIYNEKYNEKISPLPSYSSLRIEYESLDELHSEENEENNDEDIEF